jgi:hypothetical protein
MSWGLGVTWRAGAQEWRPSRVMLWRSGRRCSLWWCRGGLARVGSGWRVRVVLRGRQSAARVRWGRRRGRTRSRVTGCAFGHLAGLSSASRPSRGGDSWRFGIDVRAQGGTRGSVHQGLGGCGAPVRISASCSLGALGIGLIVRYRHSALAYGRWRYWGEGALLGSAGRLALVRSVGI